MRRSTREKCLGGTAAARGRQPPGRRSFGSRPEGRPDPAWPGPLAGRGSPPGTRPPEHSERVRPPRPGPAVPAGRQPPHALDGYRTGMSCRGPRSRFLPPTSAFAQEPLQSLAIGLRARAVDQRILPSRDAWSELEERLKILFRGQPPDDVAERLPGSLQGGQRRVRIVAGLPLFRHGINTYGLF